MIALLRRLMRGPASAAAGDQARPGDVEQPGSAPLQSPPVPEPGEAVDLFAGDEYVQRFDEAIRATQVAWYSTSLLARSRGKGIDEALQDLSQGDGPRMGRLLTSMAHESFLSVAHLTPGLDVGAATRMSAIVVELLATGVAQRLPAPRDPAAAAQALIDAAREWIATGEGAVPDLTRIAGLANSNAIRVGLLSPLAPSAASLLVVARARTQQFVFHDDPSPQSLVAPRPAAG